jgi:hypothetical protein
MGSGCEAATLIITQLPELIEPFSVESVKSILSGNREAIRQ